MSQYSVLAAIHNIAQKKLLLLIRLILHFFSRVILYTITIIAGKDVLFSCCLVYSILGMLDRTPLFSNELMLIVIRAFLRNGSLCSKRLSLLLSNYNNYNIANYTRKIYCILYFEFSLFFPRIAFQIYRIIFPLLSAEFSPFTSSPCHQ